MWALDLWRQRWGGPTMAIHDEVIALPGLGVLIAWRGGARVGLATFRVVGGVCEIVSLDSLPPGQGTGSALLHALVEQAWASGCANLRVTTTNDNLSALRFYQRRGFVLRGLRPGAVRRARRRKPQIPLVGSDGIALRDEIDLELSLGDR